MAVAAELVVLFKGNTSDLESKASETQGIMGRIAGSVGNAGTLIAGGFAVGGAAIGAAAVGAAAAWVNTNSQIDQAQRSLQATLGLTAAEAEELGAVGQRVFANNWGGSIDEATAAVGKMRQVLGDMPEDELQGVTERALALRDVFGTELENTLRTLQPMTKQFGIDGSAAMDLIAATMQKTGDPAGDLMDTFFEYSNQFKEMGFGAEQFAGILTSGLQAGAFDADRVADAVKEFNIRIRDGSDSTKEGLALLGSEYTGLVSQLQAGQITGADAMQVIIDGLAGIDDPVKQAQAGVALFGTQWEDLGPKVVTALDTSPLQDWQGAAAEAGNVASSSISGALESLKRNALLALASIGGGDAFGGLRQGAIDAINFVSGSIQNLASGDFLALFGEIGDVLRGIGGDETPAFLVSIAAGLDRAGEAAQTFFDMFSSSGDWSSGPFEGLLGSVEAAWNVLTGKDADEVGWIQGLGTSLDGVVDKIMSIDWSGILSSIASTFTDTFGGIIDVLGGLDWAGYADTVLGAWGSISDALGTLDLSGVLELVKSFGASLVEGFSIVAPIVMSLGRTLLDVLGPALAFIVKVGSSVINFLTEHKTLTLVVGGVIAAIAGGPITAFIGALVALGAGALKVKEWLAGMGDTFSSVGGIVETVKGWFSSIDLGDVIQVLLFPVFGIPDLILERLTGFSISETIAGWFEGIDLPTVIDVLLAPVFLIPNLILERLTGGFSMGDIIASWFDGGEMPDIGARLAQQIEDGLEALGGIAFPGLDLGGLDVSQQLGALGSEIQATVEGWFAPVQEAFDGAWSSIQSGIDSAWSGYQSAIQSAQDAIYNYLVGIWMQIPADIREDLALIAAELDRRWEEFKTTIFDALQSILDSINEKWSEAKEAVSSKLEEIASELSERWAYYRAIVDEALDAIRLAVQQKFAEVKQAIMGPLVEAAAAMRAAWDSAKQAVSDALGSLSATAQAKIAEIRAAWQSNVQPIIDSARQKFAELQQAVSDALSRVVGAVRDGLARARSAAADAAARVKEAILSPLQEAIARVRQIAGDIVDGLISRLAAAKDRVANALLDMVRGGLDAVKRFLGIASPSRVFEEIGAQIVAGLAGGIDDNALAAVEAASKLVGGVKSVADGLLSIFRTLSEADVPGSFAPLLATLRSYADQAGALLSVVQGVGAGIGDDAAKQIEAGSKALSSMAGAVRAVVDAVSLLGVRETTTTGGRSVITERITSFLPDEGVIDQALATLRRLATAAAELAADFGPGTQFVGFDLFAGAVGSMASALKATADLKIGDVAVIDEADLGVLGTSIERVRLLFAGLAAGFIGLDEDVQELVSGGMKRYQETVGAMFSALKSALDLSRRHQDVEVVDETVLSVLGASIERVRVFFAGLSREFIELPLEVQTLISGGLKRYQESIGAMFDVLSDVLAASRPVEDIALIDDSLLAKIGPSIERVRLFFADLAEEFIELSEGTQTLISGGLKRYQETVGAALSLLGDVLGIELPETLDFDAVDDSLLGRVGAFAERARIEIGKAAETFLALSGGEQTRLNAGIKAWVEGAGASVKLLGDVLGLDMPEKLGFEAIDGGLMARLVAFAGRARLLVDQASTEFQALSTDTRDRLTAGIKAWVESAGAAVKLLGNVLGLDRGETLVFEGVDGGLMTRLVAFAATALVRVRQLTGEFEQLDTDTRDRLTAAIKAWTDSAGASVKLVTDILRIDIKVGEGTDFSGISNLAQVVAFAKAALDEVVKVAQTPVDSEAIGKWTDSASSAVGLVSDAVSALADIGSMSAVGDLSGKLSQIEAVIRLSFGALERLLTDIPLDTAQLRAKMATASGEAVQGLAEVADGIGSILELASGGLFGADPTRGDLGFMQRVRGRRADFQASVLQDTIVRAVKAVQGALAGIDLVPDDPKVRAIGQLGDAFSKLADALTDLATAKIPDARQLAAVLAATTAVAGAVSLPPTGAGAGAGGGGAAGAAGAPVIYLTYNQYGDRNIQGGSSELDDLIKLALGGTP